MSKHWKERPVAMCKVKLRNRRVVVKIHRDKSFSFHFKRLQDGLPIITHLSLSAEATRAVMDCVFALVENQMEHERKEAARV